RIQELVKDVVQHQTSMLVNDARSVFSACSSLTPLDPFSSTTSPFLTVFDKRLPASIESRTYLRRAESTPASRAPSRIARAWPWTATMRAAPDFAASRSHAR